MKYLIRLVVLANTYCGSCGWWVTNCPHQK